MLPVYKLVLVAPRLKVPPYSSVLGFEAFVKRVSWKAKSGLSSVPEVDAKDSQKGVAPEDAMVWKPRPIRPEMGAVSSSEVVWLTNAMTCLSTSAQVNESH